MGDPSPITITPPTCEHSYPHMSYRDMADELKRHLDFEEIFDLRYFIYVFVYFVCIRFFTDPR